MTSFICAGPSVVPRAVGGADTRAVGGADARALGDADARAVGDADARAAGDADARVVGGADARAVGVADARALGGADARAVGGADARDVVHEPSAVPVHVPLAEATAEPSAVLAGQGGERERSWRPSRGKGECERCGCNQEERGASRKNLRNFFFSMMPKPHTSITLSSTIDKSEAWRTPC